MRSYARVLSDEDICNIDFASVSVLANTGIKVMNREALELLRKSGAWVNVQNEIVRMPEHMIREALDSARRRVELFSRNGKRKMSLSSFECPFLTTDGTAMYVMDYPTGAFRRGTTRDLFRFALISDYLDDIDVFWPMVATSDVPDAEHTVHEFATSILGTSKHIQHEARGTDEAKAELAIAEAVVGSADELRKRPIFSSVFSPVSPLAFEKESIDSMMLFARSGIPIVAMSIVQAGYTGPKTLAGSLTLLNAEILASLVLQQCAAEGSPFIYGIFAGPFDDNTSALLAGSPELALMSAAGAQMAAYYGLPSLASGMLTDASSELSRAMFEKMLTGLLPALAGASLVSGIGGLRTDEVVSFEQLVLDCAIWSSIKRIIRGMRADSDFIATELIQRVGPLADYLSETGSGKLPKEDFIFPKISSLFNNENSKQENTKGILEVAHEKVSEILANHRVLLLDKECEREILRIERGFRRSVAHRDTLRR